MIINFYNEASKIRVGNLFYYKRDGSYCIVRSIKPKLLIERFKNDVIESTIDQIKPIPINTKILSVCGFKSCSAYYERVVRDDLIVFILDEKDGVFTLHFKEQERDVFFVHQLQNEYFDIIGENLNPNLIGI